uniref:Uncharacterized protein n=1 Tax=Anguilla anguilla TaxID=7936 RepID=A0A0E9XDT7_ANGAN
MSWTLGGKNKECKSHKKIILLSSRGAILPKLNMGGGHLPLSPQPPKTIDMELQPPFIGSLSRESRGEINADRGSGQMSHGAKQTNREGCHTNTGQWVRRVGGGGGVQVWRSYSDQSSMRASV